MNPAPCQLMFQFGLLLALLIVSQELFAKDALSSAVANVKDTAFSSGITCIYIMEDLGSV